MGRELGWVGGRVTGAVAGGDFLGGGSGDAYGNMRAVPGFPLRISAHRRSVAAEPDFSKNPRNLRLSRFSPVFHRPSSMTSRYGSQALEVGLRTGCGSGGFSAPGSVATSMAGFGAVAGFRPQPPGARIGIPAAFR